jgi:ribosomal protein S25
MTSDAEWNPYAEIFSENEKAYRNVERGMSEGENFTVTGDRVIAAEKTIVRRSSIDSTSLAQRWGISQSLAAMTLQAMTTRAVRNYPEEEFSRRFRTRQAQL